MVCFPGGALSGILGGIMRVIRESYLMKRHQGEQSCCIWGMCCSMDLFLAFFGISFGFFLLQTT